MYAHNNQFLRYLYSLTPRPIPSFKSWEWACMATGIPSFARELAGCDDTIPRKGHTAQRLYDAFNITMSTWWCYNPAENLAPFPLHETMHSASYTYCLTMNRYSYYLKYSSLRLGDSEPLAYSDPYIHSLSKFGQRHEQQHCCMHSPDRRNQEKFYGLQKQIDASECMPN